MLLRAPNAPAGAPASALMPWWRRARRWVGEHHASLWVVGAIGVLGVAVHSVNLGTAPAPASGEGALVAAGWSIVHLGSAGDATFSSAGPSLAPVHLGGWIWTTGALGRASSAIAAGREAMLVAHIIGIPLVWVLARRSGLARWAAGGAALVFAVSPLAIALYRPVSGAGLAVPWMLAALALASARRPRAWTGVAAGLCLAVAVLTEPAVVVVAPAVGWLLWRSSPSHPSPAPPPARRRDRRYGVGWLAVTALVTSGVARGARRRSGCSTGFVWSPAMRPRRWGPLPTGSTVDRWRASSGSTASAPAPAWWRRRGAAGGATPSPDRLRLLGVCRLGAGLGRTVMDHRRGDGAAGRRAARRRGTARLGLAPRSPHRARPAGAPASTAVRRLDSAVPLVLAAAAVALVLAVPDWISTHRDVAAADAAAPLASACVWVVDNLNDGDRVIVDDAIWVDLVENGLAPQVLAGYGAVGAGPDWRSYRYIVSTPALRECRRLARGRQGRRQIPRDRQRRRGRRARRGAAHRRHHRRGPGRPSRRPGTKRGPSPGRRWLRTQASRRRPPPSRSCAPARWTSG